MRRSLRVFFLFLLLSGYVSARPYAAAQEKDFTGLVRAAKSDDAAAAVLAEARDDYFQRNDHQGFIGFLEAAVKARRTLAPWQAYYTGLARYRQMKYLEETQNWDEYFSKGNDYRKDIEQNLDRAVKAFSADDPLHVYGKLILWQHHKDQQDVFNEQALADLMSAVRLYASGARDIAPLKDVADTLLRYEERAKAKELYKVYGDKVISADLSDDELQNIAMSFYKQNNLEVAQALYTVYIDRLRKRASPEKLKLELIDIARLFSYKRSGAYDLYYAEKIFSLLEEIYTAAGFDEALTYMRANNIEKYKDFSRAREMYAAFAASYPQSARHDEALYKAGILALYADRDVKAADEIFDSLASGEGVSSHVLSSLYQRGLIAQWQGDTARAQEAYSRLTDLAKDGFAETAAMAKSRMDEIARERPLEFNIKSLLDTTLKPENSQFSMSRVEITPSAYSASPQQEIEVSSTATPPESGCLQVQLQYFWSGDMGTGTGDYQSSSFTTSYSDPGTKVIGVVATTPGGVVDRGLALIDIE